MKVGRGWIPRGGLLPPERNVGVGFTSAERSEAQLSGVGRQFRDFPGTREVEDSVSHATLAAAFHAQPVHYRLLTTLVSFLWWMGARGIPDSIPVMLVAASKASVSFFVHRKSQVILYYGHVGELNVTLGGIHSEDEDCIYQ